MTDIHNLHCIHFEVDNKKGFGVNNLPFGIFTCPKSGQHTPQVGVAIGDYILNLAFLEQESVINIGDGTVFNQPTLNQFASLGTAARKDIRHQLIQILTTPSKLSDASFRAKALASQADATLHYPFDTRGYTDFYSSENHARNVGSLFRDPENALNKNWKQLPVAYHGRTSSLVASGTDFKRPHGQILKPGADGPIYSPSLKMDYEIEMGIFMGQENEMFEPIPIDQAKDSIFGYVILNDWSARDIQAWEYVPLGPFLGKNFLTSVSPWVVTPEALEAFAADMPAQDFEPVEYLRQQKRSTFDIQLQAEIISKDGGKKILGNTNFSNQYWSTDQQIAHHTVNGCKMQTGDLIGTGTLSGPEQDQLGCLLELTKNGKDPVTLDNGETRTFIENGDTLIIRAQCKNGDAVISFGEVSGTLIG